MFYGRIKIFIKERVKCSIKGKKSTIFYHTGIIVCQERGAGWADIYVNVSFLPTYCASSRIKARKKRAKARGKVYTGIDVRYSFAYFTPVKNGFRSLNCGVARIQLRRPALRGHQGLQQVGGLPTRRLLRGQPIPEQLERRVRGRCVAVRPV